MHVSINGSRSCNSRRPPTEIVSTFSNSARLACLGRCAEARARKVRGLSAKQRGGFLARLRTDTIARELHDARPRAMPDRQSSVVRTPVRELKRPPPAWSGESDEESSDCHPLLIPTPQKSNPTERMRRIDTMLEFAVTGSLGIGCT